MVVGVGLGFEQLRVDPSALDDLVVDVGHVDLHTRVGAVTSRLKVS